MNTNVKIEDFIEILAESTPLEPALSIILEEAETEYKDSLNSSLVMLEVYPKKSIMELI